MRRVKGFCPCNLLFLRDELELDAAGDFDGAVTIAGGLEEGEGLIGVDVFDVDT